MNKFWKCPHCGAENLKHKRLQQMSEIWSEAEAEGAVLILSASQNPKCPKCSVPVDGNKLLSGGYDIDRATPEDVEDQRWAAEELARPGNMFSKSVVFGVMGAIPCSILAEVFAKAGKWGALVGFVIGAAYGIGSWLKERNDLRRSGLL